MWKIICAFLLFERALSAPSRCIEICNSMNAQSMQNCCASSSALTDNKNWTDHRDFQTNDGALVHTKDGKFAHGNTRGSFNEMSYYKEFHSGGNQNSGGSYTPRQDNGISQKLEDLSTSSHNSFEAMFQSQFSELIKNFHESFRHLQELKRKDQLPVQDCIYPCESINDQISRLQQDINSQQQHMQQIRENLWSRYKSGEAEHLPVQQQTNHYPGQVVKETNHYQAYHNEKVTTHPHVTSKPDKFQQNSQTHGQQSGINSQYDYGSGTQSQTDYNQLNTGYNRQTAGYDQQTAGYNQQNANYNQQNAGYNQQKTDYNQQNYNQNSGSNQHNYRPDNQQNTGYVKKTQSDYTQSSTNSQNGQNYRREPIGHNQNTDYNQISTQNQNSDYNQISGHRAGSQQSSIQYGQNYGTGIQSQAGYEQDNARYSSPNEGSQTRDGYNRQGSYYGHQSYGYHSQYSSHSQGGQDQVSGAQNLRSGSQTGSYRQGGYDQSNSGYRSQLSGRQTDASQNCGPQGCSPQGTTTVTKGGSYSSVTQEHGVGFGSRDGKLTHGLIQMGSSADCDDESQQLKGRYKRSDDRDPEKDQNVSEDDQSNSDYRSTWSKEQIATSEDLAKIFGGLGSVDNNDESQQLKERQKRNAYYHHPEKHHRHYQQFDDSKQEVQQPAQNLFQQSTQGFGESGKIQKEAFGEPTKVVKVSQQEIHDLGQQVQDIRRGKLEDDYQKQGSYPDFSQQDFTQQNQDFSQQSQLRNDYHQQSQDFTQQNQDFSQQSQFGNEYNQQSLDDLDHNTGTLEFGSQNKQHSNLPEQTQGFDQHPQSFSQHPQDFTQYPEDFSQQQGFQDFSQQSENPRFGKLEDQQSQKIIDSSYRKIPGFNQHTVGNLRLDEPARDSFNFNQFQTPVLAPDSNQAGNQRFNGLNQQFNPPAKPAPKPTSRPRNPKPNQLNFEKNINSKRIFKPDQDIQSSFENIKNTGRGDISAENEQSPIIDQVLTPPAVPDTQVGYQPSSKVIYKKDFGQQVLTSGDEFSQQSEKSFGDFSQHFQESNEDFSQHVQKKFDDFSQHVQKPLQDFSQNFEKSDFSHVQQTFDDFSQIVQKPLDDFSQQNLKSSQESFANVENPFENVDQQVQKPDDMSLHVQKPFEDFSRLVHKSQKDSFSNVENPFENLDQQVQKPDDGLSMHVQKPFEDFSQLVHQHFNKTFGNSSRVENFQDFSQKDLNLSQQSQEESFQKPVEEFFQSQQVSFQKTQNPAFSEQVKSEKSLDDFSRQIQKSLEETFSRGQKPFEDLSQQFQKPGEELLIVQKPVEDFSQEEQKIQQPFENVSQEVGNEDFSQELKTFNKDLSEQIKKTMEDISRLLPRNDKDLSNNSDLKRGKDKTQLPQSIHDQEQTVDHFNSHTFQQSQDVSLGHQWHLSHNPHDLTNENLHLGRLFDGTQQVDEIKKVQNVGTQKVDETQQMQKVSGIQRKQIPSNEEKEFIKFDKQKTNDELEYWREKMSQIHGTSGKLEFGQSVQNERKDLDINSETMPISLQPRILQAFGGKGSYDPMHSEDIFSDVRENPSATLPPFMFGDSWEIREKPRGHFIVHEDRVIPLETTWVYPEDYPVYPVTETPNPGFWNRFGRRFTNAVDKAKEKARDVFG